MTSTGAPPNNGPVTFHTVSGVGDTFTTPEKIQQFAQGLLDPVFASAAPGMRPKVEVYPHSSEGHFNIRTSVTGEGFYGRTAEVQTYPARHLRDEDRVKSAVWLQVAQLIHGLNPIPSPEVGE